MGGTKTSKFHDFWTCEPPGTLIYCFKQTKNTFKNIRTHENAFEHIIFVNLKIMEIHFSGFFGNGEHRQMMKIRLRFLGKS